MLPIFRRGLHFRWGEPVDVGPPDANPSDSKVQEVFERYVQALQKVFNSEKDRLLPKNVAAQGLEVMWSEGRRMLPLGPLPVLMATYQAQSSDAGLLNSDF